MIRPITPTSIKHLAAESKRDNKRLELLAPDLKGWGIRRTPSGVLSWIVRKTNADRTTACRMLRWPYT